MIIGFVGSGSMAAAMARGWAAEGDLMLFSDSGSGRAASLAEELGGEEAANAEIAARADVVIVAVKPAALDTVAAQLGDAQAIVSILGGVSLERLRRAFPGPTPVLRLMPNVAVEVRAGVLCIAGEASENLTAHLDLLGTVFEVADADFDAATAVMSCSPAYLAFVSEALTEAGVGAGLDADLARDLVVDTAAGTAELLRIHTAAAVQRAVASPGGMTEAGLETLDRENIDGGIVAAVEASLARVRR